MSSVLKMFQTFTFLYCVCVWWRGVGVGVGVSGEKATVGAGSLLRPNRSWGLELSCPVMLGSE